jgi:hypothetical protein
VPDLSRSVDGDARLRRDSDATATTYNAHERCRACRVRGGALRGQCVSIHQRGPRPINTDHLTAHALTVISCVKSFVVQTSAANVPSEMIGQQAGIAPFRSDSRRSMAGISTSAKRWSTDTGDGRG